MNYILSSLFFQDLLQKVIFPILVGTVTYISFRKLDEWKKSKNQSKLGVAIIDSLIEEVRNGITIMADSLNQSIKPTNQLPKKSWNGMPTISDDVLLRIIAVTENVAPISFPLNEIRIHCKNYFDHMTLTWENALQNPTTWKVAINSLVTNGKFIEAADNVLKMLEQCRSLLLENSKKTFPK